MIDNLSPFLTLARLGFPLGDVDHGTGRTRKWKPGFRSWQGSQAPTTSVPASINFRITTQVVTLYGGEARLWRPGKPPSHFIEGIGLRTP